MVIRLYAFVLLAAQGDAFTRAPLLGSSRALASRLTLWGSVSVDSPCDPSAPGRGVRRFYLLRHGQTDLNAAGVIQGSSDVSRLTDLGREQAKAAGLGVHELITSSRDWPNLPLAAVFISPVSRAMETLDSIKQVWETPAVGRNDIKGSSTYVSVIPGLREIDLYEWQEQSKKELAQKWPLHWAAWGADPARFALPESGQTPVVDLWRRAETVWDEIRGAPPGFAAPDLGSNVAEECDVDDFKCRWRAMDPQRRVLVVGHNAVNQALLCTACGLGPEDFRRFGFKNGGIAEVEWADGEPLARRWRWVHPLKAGWFHVLANPVLHGVSPAAMNRQEAFAAASMDGGAPCVVLVRPRVQANLGAVAQAMLNFGLSEMRLVDPFVDHLGPAAMERARGATKVLEKAKVYATVADATRGLTLTMAATARLSRTGGPMGGSFGGFGLADPMAEGHAGDAGASPQCASADEKADLASVLAKQSHSPRSCADALRLVAARNQKSGFLLGPEGTGLTVADLLHASALVHVPTHPAFSSLNIAAALTILAYESWTARYGDNFGVAADGSVVADLNIRDHPPAAAAASASEPSNGAAARGATRALTPPS